MSDFALEMRGLQGAANFDRAPLPFVAAPTCVGVGAETSASARVSDGEDWLTFCDDALSPTAALFDPTLTESAPSDLSAAQGVAALAQCAEAALFPDDDAAGSGEARTLALRGVVMASQALAEAAAGKSDPLKWRDQFAFASLAGAGACATLDRGVSAAAASVLVKWDLSAAAFQRPCGATHAQASAALLAPLLERRCAAAETEKDDGAAAARFARVAAAMAEGAGLGADAGSEAVVAWARSAAEAAGVRPLTELGLGLEAPRSSGENDVGAFVASKLEAYGDALARALEAGPTPPLPIGPARIAGAEGAAEDAAAVVRAAL
jgi:alcohol dehydrogenase class IV